MKTRGVIGKRITSIKQHRVYRSDTGDFVGYGVDYIRLENGIRLFPNVVETGYGYDVEMIVNKKAQADRK